MGRAQKGPDRVGSLPTNPVLYGGPRSRRTRECQGRREETEKGHVAELLPCGCMPTRYTTGVHCPLYFPHPRPAFLKQTWEERTPRTWKMNKLGPRGHRASLCGRLPGLPRNWFRSYEDGLTVGRLAQTPTWNFSDLA